MAQESKCALRLFILTLMLVHQLSWPDQPFTPRTLVDNRALFRVKTFSALGIKKFGSLTDVALDLIAGHGLADYEIHARMQASEILAGEWIVKHRLHSDGPPYALLFESLETELDPNWLAIETRYADTFTTHLADPGQTSERREHRHLVKQAVARMKKHRNQAFGNFRAREEIMPGALGKVLEKLGYSPDDFEIADQPVTDPLQFWNRLGLALQHYECLKFLSGKPGVYGIKRDHTSVLANRVRPQLRVRA